MDQFCRLKYRPHLRSRIPLNLSQGSQGSLQSHHFAQDFSPLKRFLQILPTENFDYCFRFYKCIFASSRFPKSSKFLSMNISFFLGKSLFRPSSTEEPGISPIEPSLTAAAYEEVIFRAT